MGGGCRGAATTPIFLDFLGYFDTLAGVADGEITLNLRHSTETR